MKIVFLKENKRENRITLLPNSLKELPKDFHIFFESGIGHKLGYKDSEYVSCGYTKCSNKDISDADIIIKLSPLTIHQQKLIKDPKQILITNTYLANNTMYLKQLLDNHIASIGIELFHENNVYPWLIKNEELKAKFVCSDLIKYLSEFNKKDKIVKTIELLEKSSLNYLIVNYSYATIELIKELLVNGHMITLLESNHEYESSLNTHKTINELISAHKGKLTIKKYSYDLLNEEVNKCDVLINTTTVPGDLTHTKITYEMLNNIKKHGVFIDLGADQGFSCEAIRFPNDKKHPYTMFKNNVSIVLDDIPSMFYAKEASIFTNKFIFDLLGHFKNDSLETIKTDKVINSALQTFGGNITNEVIGSALNLKTKKI